MWNWAASIGRRAALHPRGTGGDDVPRPARPGKRTRRNDDRHRGPRPTRAGATRGASDRRQLWKCRSCGNHKSVPTGTWKSRTDREIPTFPQLTVPLLKEEKKKKKKSREKHEPSTETSTKCYLCIQSNLLPMFPVAQPRARCSPFPGSSSVFTASDAEAAGRADGLFQLQSAPRLSDRELRAALCAAHTNSTAPARRSMTVPWRERPRNLAGSATRDRERTNGMLTARWA